MRKLFHLGTSPCSRRARLCLSHKSLEVDLLDARADPRNMEQARAMNPLSTLPILVEAEGPVIPDSMAISRYLDAGYREAPPLWPTRPEPAREALTIAALVDGAFNTLVDLGVRYYPLRGDRTWSQVQGEMIGRVQRSLHALAGIATGRGPCLTASGWSAAEIWLYTLTDWCETMPDRARTAPGQAGINASQILSLGWNLPSALSRWADHHRHRPDIQAL